jgi:hypothetical protein
MSRSNPRVGIPTSTSQGSHAKTEKLSSTVALVGLIIAKSNFRQFEDGMNDPIGDSSGDLKYELGKVRY